MFTGLVGDGAAVLPAPRFVPRVGVNLTTVPAGVAIMSGGAPRRLMKAGWIALGRMGVGASWPAAVFCDEARWVSFEREQLDYGPQGVYADRIRYHLEPGVVATLYADSVTDVPPPSNSLSPWDRNMLPISRYAQIGQSGGTAQTTYWTYTVPAGRNLWIGMGDVAVQRTAIATTLASAHAWLLIDGVFFPLASHFGPNTIGASDRDQLQSALILPAGKVISAQGVNGDTGGSVVLTFLMSGFLFDM